MNTNTHKNNGRTQSGLKKLLAIATTGAVAVVPFLAATTSEAKPPAHAPAHGYRDKDHGKKTSDARRKDKKDKDKRDKDRRDNDRRDNDRRDNDRRDNDRRDRYNRDRDDRNNNSRTFTGVVTGVRSNSQVDVRIDGQIYNVRSSNGLPRGLNRGDTVRVYGTRSGNNDINNANVSIVNNR